jgi:hypothetical protein
MQHTERSYRDLCRDGEVGPELLPQRVAVGLIATVGRVYAGHVQEQFYLSEDASREGAATSSGGPLELLEPPARTVSGELPRVSGRASGKLASLRRRASLGKEAVAMSLATAKGASNVDDKGETNNLSSNSSSELELRAVADTLNGIEATRASLEALLPALQQLGSKNTREAWLALQRLPPGSDQARALDSTAQVASGAISRFLGPVFTQLRRVHERHGLAVVELLHQAVQEPWAELLAECGPEPPSTDAHDVTGGGVARLHKVLRRKREEIPLTWLTEEEHAIIVARCWLVHTQALEIKLYQPHPSPANETVGAEHESSVAAGVARLAQVRDTTLYLGQGCVLQILQGCINTSSSCDMRYFWRGGSLRLRQGLSLFRWRQPHLT